MPPTFPIAIRWHHPYLRLTPPLIRSFNTTPSRLKHGPLPTFQPTSSPELDALLAKFRSNVFLPAHLPEVQREIIYRPKNHHLLTAEEPATVAVGNEVLQMHPLNHLHDEPRTRSALARITELMTEPRDWQNLAPFLIGLRNSKRQLREFQAVKIVRKGCEKGMEGALMECFRQARRTGLGLWHREVAVEMMWRALGRAIEGGWTEDAVNRGIELADSLWIMMQDPKHATGNKDSTHFPEVVGVMVHLHAAKAVMFQGKKDTEGKVAEYTQRLLALWDKLVFPVEYDQWYKAHDNLKIWTPIWFGMKMARKVSGISTEMRQELGVRIKEMGTHLEGARNLVVRGQPDGVIRRGVDMHEKLSQVFHSIEST